MFAPLERYAPVPLLVAQSIQIVDPRGDFATGLQGRSLLVGGRVFPATARRAPAPVHNANPKYEWRNPAVALRRSSA